MSVDIVQIIGNISQSLIPVQTLISGAGYLVGILFVITAITKFKKMSDFRTMGRGGQEKMFIPVAYLIAGIALIFLPSAVEVVSNTAFGSGNILQYSNYDPYNIYDAMTILIKTVGVLWFLRGSVLLAHASQPGVQEGPKGLAFIIAGILAINFEGSVGILNYILNKLMSISPAIRGAISG